MIVDIETGHSETQSKISSSMFDYQMVYMEKVWNMDNPKIYDILSIAFYLYILHKILFYIYGT